MRCTIGRRLLALAPLLLSVACAVDTAGHSSTAGPTAVTGDLTVFAASSLTDAFTALADAFTMRHPQVRVRFNFAASSELVMQVGDGAPADVIALADLRTMASLTETGRTSTTPVVFATNAAQIVVAAGNPFDIRTVADLADPELLVITCAPEVPCGRYAVAVFDAAGVAPTVRSYEENVRAVVAKVALGEADAGIVYVTDVAAGGPAVAGVAIPTEGNVLVEYPAALVADGPNATAGRAFLDFVASQEALEILTSFGFGAP